MLVQQVLIGLTNGALFALIALGYTMVYGIVELINFAHGDLFMLGAFLALTLVGLLDLSHASPEGTALGIGLLLVAVPAFTAGLNWMVDRTVYRPLRDAPKLTLLVSAIGVSFVFMGVGLLWGGLPMEVFGGGRTPPADKHFPELVSNRNLLGEGGGLSFNAKQAIVVGVTLAVMAALTFLVKGTRLGRAMRACAQDPVAARLMGVDVDRVIGSTFLIGGAIAGVASVVYGLYINTIAFQMGYQNGLYAFTAAVLGGIGNIPGAVLGGLVIGLVRALGSQYAGEMWTSALVFGVLILILIFRPSGILGTRTREKV